LIDAYAHMCGIDKVVFHEHNEKGEAFIQSLYYVSLIITLPLLSAPALGYRLALAEIITHTPPLHAYDRNLDSPF